MQTEQVQNSPPSVRANLIDRRQLSEQLNNIGDRTIIRYERAGMPYIAVGMLRLYDPVKVRDWLVSQERSHAAPKRGRPARKAA